MELPQVCCTTQGFPPGLIIRTEPRLLLLATVRELPRDVLKELVAAAPQAAALKGNPCIWFDVEAGRCKHHDHRPAICQKAGCP